MHYNEPYINLTKVQNFNGTMEWNCISMEQSNLVTFTYYFSYFYWNFVSVAQLSHSLLFTKSRLFFCFKRANVLAKSKMGIGGRYCFSLAFSARDLIIMQSATHSSCGQVTYHTVWQSVQSKKSYIWKKHGKRMHREEKSADLSMALNREKEKENYREYSMTFS